MAEPLPILMEKAIQIAWDYLELTGELGEPEVASRFLLDTVELMVRRGERRPLFLSNKAIDAYKQFKRNGVSSPWSSRIIWGQHAPL